MIIAATLPQVDSIRRLQTSICSATSVSALAMHAASARDIVSDLMLAEAGPALVTRCLSRINDDVVVRVLHLTLRQFRLPPARWCWMGLGSEGRLEQTLATDQDNGLLFSASDDAEARQLRSLFLPFAQAVNQGLAECGFPLCDGDVMAGNPRWCLSLSEWKEAFSTWVRTPEPDALLNASIFFDFRMIEGDIELAVELRSYISGLTRGNEIFLRMMAQNALAARPPLGRLRDFDTSSSDGLIDLKKYGTRIFVDVARILALGAGVIATATAGRLQRAADERALASDLSRASCHAFHAMQGIRLTSQLASPEIKNSIDPNSLNSFDRRVLLESFRQARALQQMLATRFQLTV
jgi:CBS domain-containing protein